MEILIPNPAIRNLIREDKIHQIYSAMQLGQEKFGMQTFNQALYSLYSQRLITLETALTRSSNVDELQDMINRGSAAGGAAQQPPASHGSYPQVDGGGQYWAGRNRLPRSSSSDGAGQGTVRWTDAAV